MILSDARVEINSVNLSTYVSQVDLSFEVEQQDDTVMGDTARSNAPGLTNVSATITFKDPFASSGPDATLFPLLGTTTAVNIRPVDTTIAATNPEYQMTMALATWNPLTGSVGDEAAATATFVNGTGSAVTRDTSP